MRVSAASSGAMKTTKEMALKDLRCDQVPDVLEKCDVSLVDNHAGVRPLPLARPLMSDDHYICWYVYTLYLHEVRFFVCVCIHEELMSSQLLYIYYGIIYSLHIGLEGKL
jgi:hypothetical protein